MSTQTAARPIAIEYVKTIGIVNNGDNGRGFANPYDTAISRDGRIFVINRCSPGLARAIRIGICNLDEEYLGEFGNGFGDGDDQFKWPVALAFDSRDRLHVTDELNHRVTVFDSSGRFLTKWGVFGEGDGELNGPSGIAIDTEDNVYLADQHNGRVQKFSKDGEYIAQWGEEGGGDGQFSLPWGVAVDSENNVYVADWGNDRIQKFDQDGGFQATYGEPGGEDGQFHRPSSVAVDDEGHIYVADWGNERVQVLGPDGSFQLKLRGQATLSKWAQDFFDSNTDEWQERKTSNLMPDLPAHMTTPYDISSQTEAYFWGPISVTVDTEGRLYVSETNRHRFQVYQKK